MQPSLLINQINENSDEFIIKADALKISHLSLNQKLKDLTCCPEDGEMPADETASKMYKK